MQSEPHGGINKATLHPDVAIRWGAFRCKQPWVSCTARLLLMWPEGLFSLLHFILLLRFGTLLFTCWDGMGPVWSLVSVQALRMKESPQRDDIKLCKKLLMRAFSALSPLIQHLHSRCLLLISQAFDTFLPTMNFQVCQNRFNLY